VTTGLQLGRPGVYAAPRRDDVGLQPVRLDVAGFVGVALRGPVDTPVLVSSWSDYERRFGAFERGDDGPDRLLPYAVQAFFTQGGVRAYAMRVAPGPEFTGPTAEEATAHFAFQPGPSPRWELAAADEGTWGTGLAIRLDFEVGQSFRTTVGPAGLDLPTGADPPDQSLVRIRRRGLAPTGELRWLTRLSDPAKRDRVVALDRPLPDPPADLDDKKLDVDVITGTLAVSDTSSALRREERFAGLGLRYGHPRFIATVLNDSATSVGPSTTSGREPNQSLLVRTVGLWDEPLLPDRFLGSRTPGRTRPGLDRSYGIGYRSFFDDGDAGDDPLDELDHHRGADAMGRVAELGLLSVPDLTWAANEPSAPSPPVVRIRRMLPCDVCTPLDAAPVLPEAIPIPPGLDARTGDGLAEIVKRQTRLVHIAELRRRFVVLVDVPSGLSVRGIAAWRAGFDSSFAAAYHPWLGVPRPSAEGGGLIDVPPSSLAAGIVAARERRFGLSWGPANEIARGPVRSTETFTDAVHDELHLLGVNVIRAERDGFRLSAARTLSSDPEYRQLSVRRLMTMLALALERQTQWLVFEPNTAELRARLTHTVIQFLRELQRRGSFAGATEHESFFVSCDDGLNPVESQRQGRLLAEVGVAPASPLEYLVLRISQEVDGTVSVGTDRG